MLLVGGGGGVVNVVVGGVRVLAPRLLLLAVVVCTTTDDVSVNRTFFPTCTWAVQTTFCTVTACAAPARNGVEHTPIPLFARARESESCAFFFAQSAPQKLST